MLKNIFELLQGWFYENAKVLNPGKYHYVIINKDIANESTDLGMKIWHTEAQQKLLGIIIDKYFNSHTVNDLFQQKGYI